MSEAVLVADNLSAGYGSLVIQRDLNFSIKKGEVFVIMGGSGCGKSTLLRHLIGLQAPLAGVFYSKVRIFGRGMPIAAPICSSTLGVLYQNGALWGGMTLRENICLAYECLATRIKHR